MDSAYAQTTTAPAKPAPAPLSPLSPFSTLWPFIPIAILFYFLLIRPQSQERKKRDEMLGGIQRGDRVLTRGGIYGIVADIKEKILILKISDNSKVEVDLSYIESVHKQS